MWIPQLPQRWEWDHNGHYHPWVLRQLPARPQRVLDVGCGSGRLASTLAAHTGHVDALDRSPAMIRQARDRWSGVANLTFVRGDLLDPAVALPVGGYDAVTAVSSVHHMPLAAALQRLVVLLRPGGVLVVVGHYRPATAADLALEMIRLPTNAAVGAGRALRGRSGRPDDPGMPMRAPSTTLADVRAAAAAYLPGARLRRGLYWRYLLTWQRPEDIGAAAGGSRP